MLLNTHDFSVTNKGNPNKWFLTENGLYEVLMQSRKPIAKEFKREVKKILHEIRMTGGYTVPQTYSEALQLAADQQKRIEEQRRLIEKQDTQIAEQRKTISEQAPKADAYDDYVDMGEFCNFRDAANYLRVTQTELMDLLRTKYIYKNEAGEYRCYAEHAECFMLRPYKKSVRAMDKDTGQTYTAERTGSQLMMTIAGLTKFGRILSEMHEERQKEIFDSAMSAARSLLQGMKPCFPMCKAG